VSAQKRRRPGAWGYIVSLGTTTAPSFAIRYRDEDRTGKLRHRQESGFRTRGAANEALQAKKAAAGAKGEAPKRFAEVAAEWLKLHSAPNLRSHQDNVERYTKHVAPALGEVLIDRITMAALLEFRGSMQAKELAPRTVNLVLALVRSILNYAVANQYLAVSPVGRFGRGKFLLPLEKTKMAPPIATLADAGRLLAVIGDLERETNRYGLRALFATLLYSGMRRGEAIGLRWADVDLDRRIITIRRSYAAQTKSGKQRTVPIATPLVAILKAHRTADPWKGPLVFPNDSGKMYSPSAKLEDVLRTALARAGMPRIRVHDLRHAAASFFLMAGGDVFTLQKILGHSTPQLVSDTYGHLSDSHLAGEADRFAFPEPGQPAEIIPLSRNSRK